MVHLGIFASNYMCSTFVMLHCDRCDILHISSTALLWPLTMPGHALKLNNRRFRWREPGEAGKMPMFIDMKILYLNILNENSNIVEMNIICLKTDTVSWNSQANSFSILNHFVLLLKVTYKIHRPSKPMRHSHFPHYICCLASTKLKHSN